MTQYSRPRVGNGVFIAFEGIDGSGKTTQASHLVNYLKHINLNPLLVKEPTNGYWGSKIKDIAKYGRKNLSPTDELEFFINDRAEDVTNNILPALNNGNPVVADRYIVSNMIYQSVAGIDINDIYRANLHFPWPDIIFIMDISVDEGLQRIAQGRGETPNLGFEQKSYLEKVKQVLDSNSFKNSILIDALKPEEEISLLVQQEINKLLNIS